MRKRLRTAAGVRAAADRKSILHAASEASARDALIVSSSTTLAWTLPFLLARAGFAVDVIATSAFLRASRFVRRVEVTASRADLARRAQAAVESHAYDWVIAADDGALKSLAALAWRDDARPRHLPIWQETCRRHLCSKIGLSRVLSAGGIRTPAFAVAQNCAQATAAAHDIGYPVMLKIDHSAAGKGVFACENDAEVAALAARFAAGPLLVQKKIAGDELDLSAVYFDGALIHFSYAVVERTVSRFGPSSVRLYHPTRRIAPAVFDELTALGRVLGASGFVTITCIDAADGSGRHYFEADMRPNVWFDFSRFYGEDLAPRLRGWFAGGARLARGGEPGGEAGRSVPPPVRLPYFLRLGVLELLVDRYRVWEFIPWEDPAVVRRLVWRQAVERLLSRPARLAIRGPLRRIMRSRLVAAGVLVD